MGLLYVFDFYPKQIYYMSVWLPLSQKTLAIFSGKYYFCDFSIIYSVPEIFDTKTNTFTVMRT